MATAYNEGSVVRLTATFRDASAVLANPTTVTLRVRDATPATTSYTFAAAQLINPSTGIFYRDVTVSTPGQWYFWFIGATGVTAADGGEFVVTAAKVT